MSAEIDPVLNFFANDTSVQDDECQCSLAFRCKRCEQSGATTSAYDTGINPVCGHLQKSFCGGCGVCTACDGCYCGEE